MTTKKHTRAFYEFFAGTGMARLGLKHAWSCTWANDNDPRKNSIYRHNFGDAHLDTRSVDVIADELAAHAADPKCVPLPFPLGVEMAWASFPCQDLSLAGWQRGMSAGRSGTYWPFWQIMFQLHRMGQRPRIIVLENVRGLLYGENLIGLCESLAALGMRLGALHMDARYFVPQSRPRIFIVAVDAMLDVSSVSDTKPAEGPWHPRSLQAAYEQLPEELKSRWVWWKIGLPPASPVEMSSIIEPHPADVALDSQAKTRQLISLMEDRSRQKVRTAKSSKTGTIGFLYKRTRNGQQRAEVRFDGIAGCLRTPKGGSSRQTVLLAQGGNLRSRLLSRIEAARLMGIPLNDSGLLPGTRKPFFPDHFTYNDAYMAMGDGVAVPVVHHLAINLLDKLAVAPTIADGEKDRSRREAQGNHSGDGHFLKKVDRHIEAWRATKKRSQER